MNVDHMDLRPKVSRVRDDWFDKEMDQLDSDYAVGYLSYKEYVQAVKMLQREYQQASKDEYDKWVKDHNSNE